MTLLYNMIFTLFFKSGAVAVLITFIIISYLADKFTNAINGGIDL